MLLDFYSQPFIIAQAVITIPEFQDAIDRAENAANEITTQWQNQWGCMLGRFCEDNFFLYRILTGFGIIAAVVTLILLILKIAKDLNDDNYTDAVPQLIWPFIVTLLLTPSFILLPNFSIANEINLPGQPPLTIDVPFAVEFPYNPLARYTIEFQRIVRAIDNAILFTEGVAGPDTNIVTLQRQAQAMTSAPATIQNFLNQCRGEAGQQNSNQNPPPPANGNANTIDPRPCEVRMVEQSANLLRAYQINYGTFPWIERRILDLDAISVQLDRVLVATRQAGGGNEDERNAAEQELRRLVSLESWLIGNGQQNTTLPKISAAIQLGFIQMLEAAWLLTAIIGPIAVGSSLLPVPAAQRAGLKWLSGYLSVGTAIIFYHLIIGIGSAVMIRASADLTDPTWFSIFLGYVAPVMALGLATGGGVALWNGLQSGVSPLFRL